MKLGSLVIAALALVASIIIYSYNIGGEHFILITDLLALIYAAIAVIIGFLTIKNKQDTLYGKTLALILAGIFLWFLAELLWFLFFQKVYILVESLRLLGYVPLTLGFFYVFRTANPKFIEHKSYITLAFAFFFVFFIAYVFLIPLALGQESLLDSITVNGYIVSDFIHLFGIILLVIASYTYRGSFLSMIWVCFALSFMSVFLFDLLFASFSEKYYFGHPYEILIIANYVFVALGFYFYHIYVISHENLEL